MSLCVKFGPGVSKIQMPFPPANKKDRSWPPRESGNVPNLPWKNYHLQSLAAVGRRGFLAIPVDGWAIQAP